MSDVDADRLQMFFEPVSSKEELRLWLKAFLKLELPDEAVDEESNSDPFNFVWDIYEAMRYKAGPKRFVVAVARNGGKTLTACIVRFLGMVHFRRSGTHLAANLEQSASANLYLEKFLMIPELGPFIKTNNSRTKELTGLPPNSFTNTTYANVRITTATIKGVNSQRGSLNTRDEVDLVPVDILSESAFIADPTAEGLPPVELNLSSRKSNSGPIQQLIDEAENGDPSIRLYKWSVVDWMWKCPPEKYRPEMGMVPVALNIENLKTTWGADHIAALSDAERPLQKQMVVPEGCRTCAAFLACHGRARLRKSTRGRLRDDQFVGNVLKQVSDPNKIIAQALNWKPETSAVVFRMFNRRRHMTKAAEFYRWTTGNYFVPPGKTLEEIIAIMAGEDELAKTLVTPTKTQIYQGMRKAGWKVHMGVDWGAIDPAVGLWVCYHRPTRRLAILHCDAATGYPNEDWAKYLVANGWNSYPGDLACPDMADTNSPIYFGRLRVPCHDKKPSRIESGVSQIRSFLWNPITQTEHFMLLDDGDMGMNRWVAECLEKWTYKKTPIGYDYKHFEDNEYTHPLDAMRYAADPWIADLVVSFASKQPKNEQQREIAAKLGDREAQKAHEDAIKQELQRAFMEQIAPEFDLTAPFKEEKKIAQSKQTVEDQRGWGVLKANPEQFVTPEKDPNEAEELPNRPRAKIKFKF